MRPYLDEVIFAAQGHPEFDRARAWVEFFAEVNRVHLDEIRVELSTKEVGGKIYPIIKWWCLA